MATKRRSVAAINNAKRKRFLVVFFFVTIFLMFKLYQSQIFRYFKYNDHKTASEIFAEKNTKAQNLRILNHHQDKAIGIDISEYQDQIDWSKLGFVDKYPINFIFVRATVGNDRIDSKFKKYWSEADKKFIRGAYHYYRPNENSTEQANLFIKTVRLEKGDFPPVLDIEKLPKNQSLDSLKVGLKRWLDKVEAHYGVKPIIYSGDKYFTDFLESEFSEYIFWIAHYNFFEDQINLKWQIWQFTEKAKIIGIRGRVDLNIYNGNVDDLKRILID